MTTFAIALVDGDTKEFGIGVVDYCIINAVD